jgi:hypothetical protein
MIAKTLFLAETFYRYGVRIFRDHESRAAEYPGGYPYEDSRLFRARTLAPARHYRAVINHRSGRPCPNSGKRRHGKTSGASASEWSPAGRP